MIRARSLPATPYHANPSRIRIPAPNTQSTTNHYRTNLLTSLSSRQLNAPSSPTFSSPHSYAKAATAPAAPATDDTDSFQLSRSSDSDLHTKLISQCSQNLTEVSKPVSSTPQSYLQIIGLKRGIVQSPHQAPRTTPYQQTGSCCWPRR